MGREGLRFVSIISVGLHAILWVGSNFQITYYKESHSTGYYLPFLYFAVKWTKSTVLIKAGFLQS